MSIHADCLSRLFDSASDLIQITTVEGQFVYANAAWCEVLGYLDTEVTQLFWPELLHPEDRDRLWGAIASLEVGEDCDLELRLLAKDGRAIALAGRTTYRVEGGKFPELWSIWQIKSHPVGVRDGVNDSLKDGPSENRPFENSLQASEDRYRQLAEGLPVLLCTFLPDSTLTYVNPAYCQYFNKRPDELLGQAFAERGRASSREGSLSVFDSGKSYG